MRRERQGNSQVVRDRLIRDCGELDIYIRRLKAGLLRDQGRQGINFIKPVRLTSLEPCFKGA